jgi:hypothetical protein
MTQEVTSYEASRRIPAPAPVIFGILASPQRHGDFDGSDMLRGAVDGAPLTAVGDIFTMRMHRLGRDYTMVNYVVELEPDRRLFWEPAPGDVDTAGGDPSRIGVPAGYRWGFLLEPDGDDATVVTEVFDFSALSEDGRRNIAREDGAWINGGNPVVESLRVTLERLEAICT